jgi:hypothetical protein
MEIAAIAATPIVKISFQSEARIFNENAPSKLANLRAFYRIARHSKRPTLRAASGS